MSVRTEGIQEGAQHAALRGNQCLVSGGGRELSHPHNLLSVGQEVFDPGADQGAKSRAVAMASSVDRFAL